MHDLRSKRKVVLYSHFSNSQFSFSISRLGPKTPRIHLVTSMLQSRLCLSVLNSRAEEHCNNTHVSAAHVVIHTTNYRPTPAESVVASIGRSAPSISLSICLSVYPELNSKIWFYLGHFRHYDEYSRV